LSKRAELAIRTSVVDDPKQFQDALALVSRILTRSDLNPQNVSRLRDIVSQQLSQNDAYLRQSQSTWLQDPAIAFRYQDNPLYLVLNSFFEQSHFDDRLSWLLHVQVNSEEIQRLGDFATAKLQQLGHSNRAEIREALAGKQPGGLEGDLINYWLRNLWSFPDSTLIGGLQTLANEVREDLLTGPAKTIVDIRQLQSILINRNALTLEITTDAPSLQKLKPMLSRLLLALPNQSLREQAKWIAAIHPSRTT
jgi:hypothetical protein